MRNPPSKVSRGFSVLIITTAIAGVFLLAFLYVTMVNRQAELVATHVALIRLISQLEAEQARQMATVRHIMGVSAENDTVGTVDWLATVDRSEEYFAMFVRQLASAQDLASVLSKRGRIRLSFTGRLATVRVEHEAQVLEVRTLVRVVEERRWDEVSDAQAAVRRRYARLDNLLEATSRRSQRSAVNETRHAGTYGHILMWVSAIVGGTAGMGIGRTRIRRRAKVPVNQVALEAASNA